MNVHCFVLYYFRWETSEPRQIYNFSLRFVFMERNRNICKVNCGVRIFINCLSFKICSYLQKYRSYIFCVIVWKFYFIYFINFFLFSFISIKVTPICSTLTKLVNYRKLLYYCQITKVFSHEVEILVCKKSYYQLGRLLFQIKHSKVCSSIGEISCEGAGVASW